MTEQVINWLLEPENPSVRYLTLTSLLGLPEDAPEARHAREAIMVTGPVPEILASQNHDGSWGDPSRYYTDKYTGSVWTLLLLAELAADPADPKVWRACEFVLQHVQEPETGGFSYSSSARTGVGLPGGIIPCLTGNMVYSLIRLGFLDDPRVRQAIDWIACWQRADDAEGPAPTGSVYNHFEACWGRHSCHMGVAKTMKALALIPAEKRSLAVAAKLQEMTEYFLKHHLYKKSHHLDEIAKPGWLKLGFPLMYQTDILELLGIFANLRLWDPRLQDALSLLTEKRQADNRWLLENTFNGKMRVRIEQKGKPSKWLTWKVSQILERFSEFIPD